VFFGTDIDTLC